MAERIPAEVFPPGEFLADELEARGWTQSEFAEIIRRPIKVVNEIIAGKKAITTDTAREFSAAFGTSPQYWMNLQTAYDLWKTAPAVNSNVIKRDSWLRQRFPVREMIKNGWIEDSKNFDVLEKRVFDFFGIANQNEEPQLLYAAKRNYREDMSPLQEAWIFRVKNLAQTLQVGPYSDRALRQSLPALEALMTEPEEVRHVPKILAECGVRFLIVEPIPNSKIDGVCFWINSDKSPVIGLTLKGDFIDRFWFNLRHEIEHALRGDGKDRIIIDDFEDGSLNSQRAEEKAANAAAENFCVPKNAMEDFVMRHDPMYSTVSLVGFARLMKRHPGIVAGQLQHKIGRPELFRKFQARIREIVIQTAFTDGYGREITSTI